MSREKKQSFMGGVTVMAVSTVFVKICGALYKIPLNNILGDEGVTHFMRPTTSTPFCSPCPPPDCPWP